MTAALLVMDFQADIVARLGSPDVVAAAGTAVDAARAAGLPVLWVRVAFRAGYPEVSQRNRAFSQASARGEGFAQDAPGTQIDAALSPRADEPVVLKRRVSAFAGSDLEVLTRGLGVDTLVLAGISTSGVVLSTLREAADKDYGLVVLADACADGDPEVHRVLTEKVFPRQAEVTTVETWATSLA
ncbi:MAG: cysteine hydrolase [Promicromonosporaceae bacterium]|nr:cysteine hydrolase [Promicromonosporaceae bacterium]